MATKRRVYFVTEVKNELTQKAGVYDDPAEYICRRAELAALFRMGGTLKFKGGADGEKQFALSFANNNAAVTRRVFALLRAEDANLPLTTAVARANRFRKRNSYIVSVKQAAATNELLQRLEFIRNGRINIGGDGALLSRREDVRQAYLLGAFLGGGSINRPDAENHLELKTGNLGVAELLQDILRRFDLPAGFYERRDEFVVYLKDYESIVDFLSFAGARNAVERCEIARNVKDVRRLANQLVNCETHNLQNAVDAAQRQLADIKLILEHDIKLSFELDETAQARLRHPEMSMPELASLLYVSRSALKNRMRGLRNIAAELRQG